MTEEQNLETAPEQTPPCPKCGGDMWDNRASKRNPRAPDFKCKSCDGVIWPPREAGAAPAAATPAGTPDDPPCPVCGGKMWDDRASKRNPRAPDFKCRNKPKVMGGPGCPGVIWPPRPDAARGPGSGERRPAGGPAPRAEGRGPRAGAVAPPPPSERDFSDDEMPDFGRDEDDLPF